MPKDLEGLARRNASHAVRGLTACAPVRPQSRVPLLTRPCSPGKHVSRRRDSRGVALSQLLIRPIVSTLERRRRTPNPLPRLDSHFHQALRTPKPGLFGRLSRQNENENALRLGLSVLRSEQANKGEWKLFPPTAPSHVCPDPVCLIWV